MFNIVLIQPEIPTNTGNIGRLSLASGCNLHLVKPLGFDLSESRVKRAGLDYWKHVPLTIYEDTDAFFSEHKDKEMSFLSSHGKKNYCDINFTEDMYLIFGKESVGLPKIITDNNSDNLFQIPIFSSHVRSLNLANAVGIVVYEGIRQIK